METVFSEQVSRGAAYECGSTGRLKRNGETAYTDLTRECFSGCFPLSIAV